MGTRVRFTRTVPVLRMYVLLTYIHNNIYKNLMFWTLNAIFTIKTSVVFMKIQWHRVLELCWGDNTILLAGTASAFEFNYYIIAVVLLFWAGAGIDIIDKENTSIFDHYKRWLWAEKKKVKDMGHFAIWQIQRVEFIFNWRNWTRPKHVRAPGPRRKRAACTHTNGFPPPVRENRLVCAST